MTPDADVMDSFDELRHLVGCAVARAERLGKEIADLREERNQLKVRAAAAEEMVFADRNLESCRERVIEQLREQLRWRDRGLAVLAAGYVLILIAAVLVKFLGGGG